MPIHLKRVNYFDAFPNVPMSERRNYKITNDNLGHGGVKTKYKNNIEAKSPVRVADDIDATALSYAEIKALATGNPLIIEKCQLEADVSKLKILQASHLSQHYALEDKLLKEYPKSIKLYTEEIAGYKADIETATAHPSDKDHFPPMKIGGIVYSEKKEAGAAIIAACQAMTSSEAVSLGEYRGFSMEVCFYQVGREYNVILKGALTYYVSLGSDIFGNITRIDNAIEKLPDSLNNYKEKLADTKAQMEAAQGELNRPFAQEAEFEEKSARLKELDILLNMDEKDKTILNCEPDEGDIEPTSPHKSRDEAR
jgi:hypothetical protein